MLFKYLNVNLNSQKMLGKIKNQKNKININILLFFNYMHIKIK